MILSAMKKKDNISKPMEIKPNKLLAVSSDRLFTLKEMLELMINPPKKLLTSKDKPKTISNPKVDVSLTENPDRVLNPVRVCLWIKYEM